MSGHDLPRLPASRYTTVEFPGHVTHPTTAIEMLGGLQCIPNATVHFDPHPRRHVDDPPTLGHVSKTCNVLLRVTVVRDTPQSAPSTKVDVLGRVSTHTEFVSTLADMDYRAPQSQPYLGLDVGAPDLVHQRDLFSSTPQNVAIAVRPRSFLSYSGVPFHYQSNPVKRTVVAKNSLAHTEPSATPQKGCVVLSGALARSGVWPTAPPSSSASGANSGVPVLLHHVELHRRVKELFDSCPVWTGKMAMDALGPDRPRGKPVDAMAEVALWVASGPFSRLWIKFGYDPRATPEGLMHQSVDFRLPYGAFAAIQAEARRSGSDLFYSPSNPRPPTSPDHPPPPQQEAESSPLDGLFTNLHRQYTFRIMDLTPDPEIRALVETHKLATYDPDDGWLSGAGMGLLRGVLRVRLLAHMGRVLREPYYSMLRDAQWDSFSTVTRQLRRAHHTAAQLSELPVRSQKVIRMSAEERMARRQKKMLKQRERLANTATSKDVHRGGLKRSKPTPEFEGLLEHEEGEEGEEEEGMDEIMVTEDDEDTDGGLGRGVAQGEYAEDAEAGDETAFFGAAGFAPLSVQPAQNQRDREREEREREKRAKRGRGIMYATPMAAFMDEVEEMAHYVPSSSSSSSAAVASTSHPSVPKLMDFEIPRRENNE